jgi:hypothetical protein
LIGGGASFVKVLVLMFFNVLLYSCHLALNRGVVRRHEVKKERIGSGEALPLAYA